jgi:hypothetical protein
VRQQDRRNIRIILQQVPLGNSTLRPEDFVEVAEFDLTSSDLEPRLWMAGKNYNARFPDCGRASLL